MGRQVEGKRSFRFFLIKLPRSSFPAPLFSSLAPHFSSSVASNIYRHVVYTPHSVSKSSAEYIGSFRLPSLIFHLDVISIRWMHHENRQFACDHVSVLASPLAAVCSLLNFIDSFSNCVPPSLRPPCDIFLSPRKSREHREDARKKMLVLLFALRNP